MPSLREMVFHWPVNTARLNGVAKVDQLFKNMISYGRLMATWHYQASSTVTKDQILDGTNNGVVYCEPLADAFRALVEEACGKESFKFEAIHQAMCLLRRSPCIDRSVVGNVRIKNQTYAETNQCFFTKHVYMQVEYKFYDPCMASVYREKNEPVLGGSWLTVSKALRINSFNPRLILKALPSEKPPGFESGFLACSVNDLEKREVDTLLAALAKTDMPKWKVAYKQLKLIKI